ncbi:protein takeout-like [Teleopsis dalmanni]|uniref:protein takeout-like n=1 Tax=Teleopsis dalmanni TaxID=139649 RepID=UPI0018CCEED1|nr:protein takeout-like [Teleopsis dalmanni]
MEQILNKFLNKKIILILLFYINITTCVKYYTTKPDYLKSCTIYKPEFTKCSTESIQGVMSYIFTNSLPELKEEFGSLDPMKLDQLLFKQDNNEAVTIRANLTNLLVRGLKELKIKESRVSKKDFSWETKIFIPHFRIDGNYKMEGRILLIPLSGNGKMFIELENLDIIMHTKTRLFERGNFTFYNVTNIRVDLNLGGLKTYFDNLFNGRSLEVERSTNQFFNENWPEFFEALRPLISETVERVLFDILHKVFDIIPANFFVEDIPTSKELYKKKS